MSFSENAEYTVRTYRLSESPEAVMAEWMRLAADEYARDVQLVPGARDYLRALKRAGVKMAAATVNRRALIDPALENCGIAELFDAILTASEVGDGNKSDGALFRLAAERLHLKPDQCVVFEDALEGLRGARAAGMRVFAVKSIANAHCMDEVIKLSDVVLEDYTQLEMPSNDRRAVIFTAWCEGDQAVAYVPVPDDFIICADAGWKMAKKIGVLPDIVLGDFDSGDAPLDGKVMRYPVEKDDTDTMLCVKTGFSMGFERFLIVGGFGGRLDHTLGNLQTLNYIARRGGRGEMRDGRCWATVLRGGTVRVPRTDDKLSVISMDEVCRGVTIKGAKYETDNIDLGNATSLGVGNSVTDEYAEISVQSGSLLVLTSPDISKL